MGHKISRIFHPVGQGAFYSERHDVDGHKFNIVYDCGSFNVKQGTRVVEKAFGDKELIDILFISHFDYDHFSLLSTLTRKWQVRKVVLPLLYDDIRFALSGYYHYRAARNRRLRSFNEKSLRLLNDPQSVFQGENRLREKMEFVFVRPDGESSAARGSARSGLLEAAEQFASGRGRVQIISSRSEEGSKQLFDLADWLFLPYNMDYYDKNRDLVEGLNDWLNRSHHSWQDLNDARFFDKAHCQQLAGIYKSLAGTINENSMLLFSGPLLRQSQYKMKAKCCAHLSQLRICDCCLDLPSGCLYSGDFNLKQESLSKSYGAYFDRIGTVQIPHHGSVRSFDLNNFYARGKLCPVSYGVNNRFGHPDQAVVDDIVGAGNCPIFVTNDRLSEFEETIWL